MKGIAFLKTALLLFILSTNLVAAGPCPRILARVAGFVLPGFVPPLESEGRRVLERLWRDPSDVRPDDYRVLKAHGLVDAALRQMARAEKYPYLRRLSIRLGSLARWGSRISHWTIAALSIGNAVQQMIDDRDNPDVDQYLSDPKFAVADDEVQLVVNTVPFPHLAIRIGDRVYSYGTSQVTSTSAATYFREHGTAEGWRRLARAYEDLDGLPEREQNLLRGLMTPEDAARLTAEPADSSGKIGRAAMEATGARDWTRNYQIVQLKVGREERDRLMRHFEMQKGKVYDNRTFVNDCSTMVCRALGMANPVIDPSPSTIVTTMQLRRAAGDERVRKVFTVYGEGAERRTSLLLRDAYINYREGALHFQLLPLHLPERVWLDRKATPDSLQRWREEARRAMEEWRGEAREMAEMDFVAAGLRQSVERVAALDPADPRTARKRAAVTELVDDYLKRKREQADAEYRESSSTLRTVYFATYKLEHYAELERDVRRRLGAR